MVCLRGDVEKLRSVFDSHAIVVGEIHQQPYYKTIEAYLDGVASRQSPEKLGERVQMELISLDVTSNIASAKLHVRMLGFNYFNFLFFIRQAGEWRVLRRA
jgi:Putative lumazine-binding